MLYTEAIDWLYSQLPLFQKEGKTAYHPGLDNIKVLLEELGNPQKKFKTIHVAGTNGKGSVSHMLSAVLQKAGYKTGLYTSPHLRNFEERVKINGIEIRKDTVIDFTLKMQQSEVKPSFFEMTVALAFEHFANQKVDIAVIETGMGGRLDSTNVIQPELCIITNISLDHQQYLGDTLDKIAFEKAGIIKSNIPVVIGESLRETASVFLSKAKEVNAPIIFAEKQVFASIVCDLKGNYQEKNIQTVRCALGKLQDLNYRINQTDIIRGLSAVQALTGLKGRYQTLGYEPRIIADTGHNISALKHLIPQLLKEKFHTLHIVFGMANDKDIEGILKLLPKNAQYYFCRPNVPRGLNEKDLQEEAKHHGLEGGTYSSVEMALSSARKTADLNDLIFVGGSTFVVAEVI